MAEKKITELDALGAAPDPADILAIVDDVGGAPVTKKNNSSIFIGRILHKNRVRFYNFRYFRVFFNRDT